MSYQLADNSNSRDCPVNDWTILDGGMALAAIERESVEPEKFEDLVEDIKKVDPSC